MKNLKILFFILVATIFSGCTSDDDGGSGGGISASIIGTWDATDVDIDGIVTIDIDGNNISQNVVGEPQNLNYAITFNEDNTVTATGDFDIEITFSFLGQTFEETLEDIDPVGTGTWALSGNQLTITSGGESQVVIIDELSESLLTLRIITEESTVVDGQQVDGIFESTMFLSRQ